MNEFNSIIQNNTTIQESYLYKDTIQHFNNSTIQSSTIQTKKDSPIGPKTHMLFWLSMAQLSPLLFDSIIVPVKSSFNFALYIFIRLNRVVENRALTNKWLKSQPRQRLARQDPMVHN